MDEVDATVDATFQRLLARPGTEVVILMTPLGQVLRSASSKDNNAKAEAIYGRIASRIVSSCGEALSDLAELHDTNDNASTTAIQQEDYLPSFVRLRTAGGDEEFYIVTKGKYLLAVVYKKSSGEET